MSETKKIIIDTDIGDDIDDALALYAAMRQGFEIVGITTVFRNTADRAKQVKKLLRDYGHGYEAVPVLAGHGAPIGTLPQAFEHIPHYTEELEDNLYTPDSTDPDKAVDFIIDACRRYGKELTVVAIGPFTNLARVIERDPEALNLASKVVIMGGAYFKQYADWNVMCDVTAADILYRGVDRLECIGADVTHLTVADEALYNNLMNNGTSTEPAHVYLEELCRLWRKDRPRARLVLHDPLVIYYLADPLLCEMKEASVVVITDGYARAMTLNVDAYAKRKYHKDIYADVDETHKARVAFGVDLERFLSQITKDFDA